MARFTTLSDRENPRFGEHSYDVRDWSVRTGVDDERIGKVRDVLTDDHGRTRYLDVELEKDRHVLLPSGEARIDAEHHRVYASGLDRNGLTTLPRYDGRPETITPDYSRSLADAYDRAYADEHRYERSDYARERTAARERRSTGKLARLDKLDDIRVASGDPDPRGWDVTGSDGKRVGKVDHIIGDTEAMKARYLVVELDREIVDDGRSVLLPVGHTDVDADAKRVRSDALTRSTATRLPAYEGGTIDREYESDLRRRYSDAYGGERHYEHPRYRSEALDTEEAHVKRSEEELSVGKRKRKSGEVDVKKRVETEHVREPVDVRREEVEVERRPASDRGAEARVEDDEVRVPVHEEEVVVEKKPRTKEEIVVKKREVEDTEVVEEDVKKERVDVDRRDSPSR